MFVWKKTVLNSVTSIIFLQKHITCFHVRVDEEVL